MEGIWNDVEELVLESDWATYTFAKLGFCKRMEEFWNDVKDSVVEVIGIYQSLLNKW